MLCCGTSPILSFCGSSQLFLISRINATFLLLDRQFRFAILSRTVTIRYNSRGYWVYTIKIYGLACGSIADTCERLYFMVFCFVLIPHFFKLFRSRTPRQPLSMLNPQASDASWVIYAYTQCVYGARIAYMSAMIETLDVPALSSSKVPTESIDTCHLLRIANVPLRSCSCFLF